jgi:uroporphyrin-III C-methyltransferase / precorrin-2 dehydrogenase / sirohydrochlorin ferrochelatase
VPGITAALGCAAHARVPLTHRDHAQTLVFVTGHTKDGEVELDWPALVRPHQTVVVYMGAKAVGSLCAKLLAHGLDAETPAALIENGTYPHQRTITATVATLPGLVPDQRLLGPSLIVIGRVVGLRARLAWLAERADEAALAASKAE